MKSVLVTGGASGIGAAAVRILAARGDAVTIADREPGGQTLADQLSADGRSAQFVPTDVLEEESIERAVQAAVSRFGRLDAAINSAGVEQAARPIHELSAADWDRGVGINLRGMFLCLKHEVAAMIPNRAGAIVALSSAAAVRGLFSSADYCAAKAGVLGLVRAAAVDCAEHNIRVNALLPGGTDTPLAHRSAGAIPKLAGTLRMPLGRMASAEEIGEVAVWLVSDAASYVTGASIAADGGMAIA